MSKEHKKITALSFVLIAFLCNYASAHSNVLRQDTIKQGKISYLDKKTGLKEDIKFYFRIDSHIFESEFDQNKAELERLDKIIAEDNAFVELDSLILYASASIDGTESHNEILAEKRAETIKNLMLKRYPKIKPEDFVVKHKAEDWEGLRALISEDKQMPYKSEVLAIIDDATRTADEREQLLKSIHEKEIWEYLKENILPKSRFGASLIFYYNIEREKLINQTNEEIISYVRDTIFIRDTLRITDSIVVRDVRKRKFFKTTNLSERAKVIIRD